jgi:hypothetical protein
MYMRLIFIAIRNYRANNFASQSVERAYVASKISLVILLFASGKMSKVEVWSGHMWCDITVCIS